VQVAHSVRVQAAPSSCASARPVVDTSRANADMRIIVDTVLKYGVHGMRVKLTLPVMKLSAGYRLQRVVGKNVKALRVRRGLTQEEAAHRAKLDYKRWQRIEAGRVNVTLHTLVSVSAALAANPKQLLDE